MSEVRCAQVICAYPDGRYLYCRKKLAVDQDGGKLIIECPRCRDAGRQYMQVFDERQKSAVA